MDPADWEGWTGRLLEQKTTGTFYVAPKNLTFESGRDYNLTVITSRKNRFSFTLNVNENNIRNEKIEITKCSFYYWPPGSWEEEIRIEVKNIGGTAVIIKKTWIDSTLFHVSPLLRLDMFHSEDGIELSFPWKDDETYIVFIETVAGSIIQKTVTAHWPP